MTGDGFPERNRQVHRFQRFTRFRRFSGVQQRFIWFTAGSLARVRDAEQDEDDDDARDDAEREERAVLAGIEEEKERRRSEGRRLRRRGPSRGGSRRRGRAGAAARSGASIASRGAPRMPLPSRSTKRSASTCVHELDERDQRPDGAGEPVAASTIRFGAPVRSARRPAAILRTLLAASATPSMTPSDIALAPSTRVRNIGSSG